MGACRLDSRLSLKLLFLGRGKMGARPYGEYLAAKGRYGYETSTPMQLWCNLA